MSYADQYRDIDFRKHPEQYEIGRGEQGVLIAEPYKSEILPYWKFATPDKAEMSAAKIYELFESYRDANDFVGMDMARKFLQMGYTRARRYANYKGGRKYDAESGENLTRGTGELLKAESAKIFYDVWKEAEANPSYRQMKSDWKKRYG